MGLIVGMQTRKYTIIIGSGKYSTLGAHKANLPLGSHISADTEGRIAKTEVRSLGKKQRAGLRVEVF